LLETQNSLFTASSGKIIYSIPEFISRTGIYFKDYLFNDNLDLKAGFIFTYFGDQNYNSVSTQINKVPAVSRLDFSLAGEIQKAAIVYFIWENLFDKKYYLTPYYPMPFRNIRFGVAWEFLN
jgi:outer membrane cobalamin receptor